MELDDEDKLDWVNPTIKDAPDYPYGLRISLTEKEFKALGIDPSDAFPGGIVHLHALARITSVNVNDGENGASCRVELQITDLCIESEDEENSED